MAITLKHIQDLVARADTENAAMVRSMALAEAAYHLRLNPGIKLPKDTPVHYPSTAPAIVDHFTDQVRTSNAEVRIGPIGKGSKGEERRSTLESLGRMILEKILLYQDEPIGDYVAFNLSLLGASDVSVLYDEALWSDDAAERRTSWPFIVRVNHPANVIISPGYRWPYTYVIERQRRFVRELKADYNLWRPLTPNGLDDVLDDDDDVEVFIYWGHDGYAMFAGNNEVFQRPNALGIPPHIWSFSGIGHRSGDADPDSQAAGILKHTISELASEIRLKTAGDSVWVRYVWPALFGTIPEAEFQTKWSAGAGRYIAIHDMDEMPQFLPPPEINQGMWAMLPMLKASIERATYSPVLEGQPGTANYGVLYGMQLGQARLRVDAVRHAVERVYGRIIGLIAMYLEKVVLADGSSLDVYDKVIHASDINGHYDFRVKFEALDAIDNDRRVQTGLALRQAGAITLRTLLRDYVGSKDVDGEEEGLMVEKAIAAAIESGQLTPAIVAAVGNEEALAATKAGAPPAGAAPPARGAPYGDRLNGPIPGGAGPSPTARTVGQ